MEPDEAYELLSSGLRFCSPVGILDRFKQDAAAALYRADMLSELIAEQADTSGTLYEEALVMEVIYNDEGVGHPSRVSYFVFSIEWCPKFITSDRSGS